MDSLFSAANHVIGGIRTMLKLKTWLKNETGQGILEYGMIIALIAAVVITALVILGPKISAYYDDLAEKIPSSASERTDDDDENDNGNNGNHNGHNK
jgi:pilus assembly protein Flp/PilA